MAENLQNLYSTTLASSYTIADGQIIVAAAPAAGNGTYTMSLVIRNSGTGAVILIFRVTSVSGTTLTGAAEGTDANAASGSTVDGSQITVASLGVILGGNYGPIYPSGDPKLQSFAWINQASATLDISHNGIGIVNPTIENNFNIHARVFAVPATPYHVEFCMTMRMHNDTNLLAGVCFADGNSGTPKMMIFGRYQIADQLVQFYASSPTVYGGSTPINNTTDTVGKSLIFFRLGDDGSGGGAARTYDVSHDGVDWFNLGGESRSSQFVATHIGILLNSGPLSLRCYSIKITG